MEWNEFLREAIAENDLDLVEQALREGADPNTALLGTLGMAEDAQTALYWAAFGGRSSIVQILLTWGARVMAEQGHEFTSLHAAVEHNDAAIVGLLLAADGYVALNWFDYVSRTPLIIAVEMGNVSIARMLIDAGADVNANEEERIGDTALHEAAARGSLPMAKLLIAAGADPHIQGWMWLTPLGKAQERKRGMARQSMLCWNKQRGATRTGLELHA